MQLKKSLSIIAFLTFNSLSWACDFSSVAMTLLETITLMPPFIASTLVSCIGNSCKEEVDNYDEIDADSESCIGIVLIHGKSANKNEFIFLKSYLSHQIFAEDIRPIVFNLNINEDDNGSNYFFTESNASVEDRTEELAQKISLISAGTGINTFILIGHSLGGILSALYEKNYAKDANINIPMVITINSPLGGSPFIDQLKKYTCGWFEPDHCLKQLNLGSSILEQIRAHAELNDVYYHIVGLYDLLVPASYAQLEQEDGHVSLHANSHFGTVVNPSVFLSIKRMINQMLNAGLFYDG